MVLHLAVIFYLIIVLREFFALRVLSPGWASVRILAWMGAASAAVASTLMWLNVRGFYTSLTEDATRRMTAGRSPRPRRRGVLLVIAIAHYSFGRRGSRVGASLFVLATFASLASAAGGARSRRGSARLQLRDGRVQAARRRAPGQPRVTMILLDGASLDYVLPRVAEGQVAGLCAATRERGGDGSGDGASDAARSGVGGGRHRNVSVEERRSIGGPLLARSDDRIVDLLPDHCFSHALVYLGFIRDEPNASNTWRARPLWSIASKAGVRVGIVRWPLTYPAEEVDGFIVSDRFHQLVGFDRGIRSRGHATRRPAVAGDVLLQTSASGARSVSAGRVVGERPEESALRRDRWYSAAMRNLAASMSPRLTALRYEGLDTVGHYYLRYTLPRTFRDLPEEERRRFSQVIDRYYAYIDGEVGASLAGLTSDDLLVVVSGFGMQPLNPMKQTIGRMLGDPDFSGTHERAPDGFLMAYGNAVEPGRRPRGSIVDVTPDRALFPGPARRPRHGRLCTRRSLHPRIHRRSTDCVYSELSVIVSSFQFPVASSQCFFLKLATGNWQLATGNWKLETDSSVIASTELFNASLRGRQEVKRARPFLHSARRPPRRRSPQHSAFLLSFSFCRLSL